MTNDIIIVTAGALIDPLGRTLVQQRPPGKAHAGLWEFPGGKVEAGEVPEVALARELREELAITVEPDMLVPVGFARSDSGTRPLLLLLYACRHWQGVPRACEAMALHWDRPDVLTELPMPPADYPLARDLSRWLADSASGTAIG